VVCPASLDFEKGILMIDYKMFDQYNDIMTIEDVQKCLEIGRTTAYKLLNSGKIRHMRIGTKIKIPKQFLVEYINRECYNDLSNGLLVTKKEAS